MDRTQLNTALYVDDEPDIREIIEMALGLIDNLTVRTCGSDEQALTLWERVKHE
jgi:two-component system, OmpR family, response regulator